ncbi:hypothetical protein PIB30_053554, partial [Stylosanthes scabra]|nr:hypothetical protein [Stylosanthes scabra]
MAVNESLAGSNEEIDRVSAIKATKLGWNLVVGVVRLYELPNQWISKDATSIKMVLQDQNGDRIHCSIGRTHVGMFKSLFRENEIYAMRNFIVQNNSKPPRTTAHKFKLSFYVKTEAAVLRNSKIPFAPFNFFPYYDIEPMPGHVDQFLI